MSDAIANRSATLDIATDGFLSRYAGATKSMYAADLRIYFQWCADAGLDPLDARRADLEAFVRHMIDVRGNAVSSAKRRAQTVRGFYRLAHADELIARDPSVMMRLPKIQRDPHKMVWLDRFEVGAMIRVARNTSPAHHALVGLLSLLGLRVSAACRLRIEDIWLESDGKRYLRVLEKNSRMHVAEIPGELWMILQEAIGERTEGPVILRRNGTEQDRAGAYRWVRTIAAKAGLPSRIHPHTLRRSMIAILLDSDVDVSTVQWFAGHVDPRTTLSIYHPVGGPRKIPGSFFAAAALSKVA